MTPFRTADIILPCNELSIEAASISGLHAESESAEDAATMRSIKSFLLMLSGSRRKNLAALSNSATVNLTHSHAVKTA